MNTLILDRLAIVLYNISAAIPPGPVFGQGYLRTLRPIIREAYYKTPAWLLKIIKPIFGI